MKHMNTMRFAARAFGRGVRVMAAFDVARARTRCQELQSEIRAEREKLAGHVQAGTGTQQELQEIRDGIARRTQEYSDLMGALNAGEREMAGRVAAQFERRMAGRENAISGAIGGYFRAMITGTAPEASVLAALSLPITTGSNPGNGLLPINVSNELIDDIYGDDGFLTEVTHSQIKGLRLPKVTTTETSTDAAVAAGSDPTEHNMDDDEILFGRFPGRDMITVPGAVMRGTNLQLGAYIESKLQEIHRNRIYRRLFAASASGNYTHMSVYNAAVGIAEVSGSTMYDAICAALAALPASVRSVAKVAMQPMDYFKMVKELTNGAATLFGRPQESMLGFAVVLCDYATQPIVGDLKTIRVNYDDALYVKSDEDIKKDVVTVVVGGDYDIQVEDKNRLRRVKVAAA